MANARMRNKAEDFERMSVDPKAVAPWEDGRRNGDAVGCIEWWYFDADLDDGTKINLNFATNPVSGHPEPGFHPFFYANIQEPGRDEINDFAFLPAEACSFAEGGCDVEIGKQTFSGDLEHVEDVKGVSFNLTLRAAFDAMGVAPSITRHAAIGKLTIEHKGEAPIVVEGPLHYELSSQCREFIM